MEQRFKVIVADDERLIAKIIAKNIERINNNFQVIYIAHDGLGAYEQTAKLLPDIVFSDIKMPEMDGIELIKRIHTEFPFIKTVIVSGFDDFEFARSALRNRAVDYLLKPINPEQLRKTLQHLETELLASKQILTPRHEKDPAEIVEGILSYLHRNFAAPDDFSRIAEQYGFSAAYLSKIFKEYTGTTPQKYLSDYRMKVAKKLLLDTSLSVKQVAERVGYLDQFHFSKNFKSYTGLSPLQFRDQKGNVSVQPL